MLKDAVLPFSLTVPNFFFHLWRGHEPTSGYVSSLLALQGWRPSSEITLPDPSDSAARPC
jgi:hypothetical protein